MKYNYFPGCSLKGLGKAYEESFLSVFKALDATPEELNDWNCCGATAYMSVDENDAFALAARNLAIAEKTPQDVLAPCSACYLVLNKTKDYVSNYPELRKSVAHALNNVGLEFKNTVKVRHPLDVMVNDIGLKTIKEKVKKPLKGLKVAPYYGCQIVRPYSTFDDQDNPTTMDELMKTIGAESVFYPLKTKCCGGSLTGTINDIGKRLCYILLKDAQKRGADMIVTVCPLCHFNLDAYQDQIAESYEKVDIPVVYFTQLVGLAMGLSAEELGLKRNIVSALKVLKEKELVTA